MGESRAPKRGKMQIQIDRALTTDMLLQGYTHQQIADAIYEKTGTKLTRKTITNDIRIIRKQWMERQQDQYGFLVNRELSRMDMVEGEAWKAWKASCAPLEQKTIEEISKEVDGDLELVVERVVTMTRDNGLGVGDPRFLNTVMEIQKERRRLLGLYAPSKLGLDITKKSELTIKGYGSVSPDDWPDIVEGEVVQEIRKEIAASV